MTHKSRSTFEKSSRERAKRQKRQEKQARRLERKAQRLLPDGVVAPQSETDQAPDELSAGNQVV